jgi:hypothetical protein
MLVPVSSLPYVPLSDRATFESTLQPSLGCFFLAIEVWCRVAHGDPQICHDDHRFTQSEILSL